MEKNNMTCLYCPSYYLPCKLDNCPLKDIFICSKCGYKTTRQYLHFGHDDFYCPCCFKGIMVENE